MTKTRARRKEKDQWDTLPDQIDFKGLTQEEVLGQDGLVKQLMGRILRKALEAEMTVHLGYEKNSNDGDHSGDSRNGYREKPYALRTRKRSSRFPGTGTGPSSR